MSTCTGAEPKPLSTSVAWARVRARHVPAPELLGLVALAAVLNLWSLSRNAWANDYYAAAVRSMSTSWHNFFFASFDASGIMTVDKPPLALWVQALSARIFGFHSLSVLVPQALMGVASVALVYDLTRRVFGRPAGFVAGAVLALTPMTVAISRHNNPDALLVLCCVGAVWALVRALEDGRTRWLVLSGLLVGLGFETKMGVALMVVPGIAAAWLWFSPAGRGRALKQLIAGGAAMAIAGLAWPVAVWLTPAADRPWISGTSDNSIWSLIWGYNGVGRLDGQAGGPAGGGAPGGNAGPFGGSAGPAALAQPGARRASWLAAWLLDRVRDRCGRRVTDASQRPPSSVACCGRRGLCGDGPRVQFRGGNIPPVLRVAAGAVQRRARGSGRRARRPRRTGDAGVRTAALIAGAGTEIAVLSANPGQLTWLK